MSTSRRDFCLEHRILAPAGEPCPQCAMEAAWPQCVAASDPAPIMMSALPDGAFAFCPNHDILYHIGIGARCPLCQRAQRDTIGVLEGRVADHDAELQDLRRRLTALEHQLLTMQEQANRKARQSEYAQRIVDDPTTRTDIREAAQRYIDRTDTLQ